MKPYSWNEEKNSKLKTERQVSFEDVVAAIEEGRLLETIKHPNSEKYPNQKVYVVQIHNYAYSIPFTENNEVFFLKTIFPSRKYTRKYLRHTKERTNI